MDERRPVPPAPAPEVAASNRPKPDTARPAVDGQQAPPAGAPATAAEQLISRQLRAIYDEVVNEPIPDHLVRLLEELERKRADKS